MCKIQDGRHLKNAHRRLILVSVFMYEGLTEIKIKAYKTIQCADICLLNIDGYTWFFRYDEFLKR